MKRQKAKITNGDNDTFGGSPNRMYMDYRKFTDDFDDPDANGDIPLRPVVGRPKYRNTLEAQIQEGDTLQAIAIRYNCSVADLKRLNKIEREYEIHARKTLKIPLTPDTILLQQHPIVHKSGQSSPKHNSSTNSNNISATLPKIALSEKLLIASVSLGGQSPLNYHTSHGPSTSSSGHSAQSAATSTSPSINEIILNTKISRNNFTDDTAGAPDDLDDQADSAEEHLLKNPSHSTDFIVPHSIPVNTIDLSFSGTDCDMSWICLFVCILALCFAIPLIYVIYIAEHPNEYHHSEDGRLLANST